ncbi:MAG: peptidase S8 [Acidobacteria bacterium]|nr:MAG: peptidase S8 [Acidobacteriota bacterium]
MLRSLPWVTLMIPFALGAVGPGAPAAPPAGRSLLLAAALEQRPGEAQKVWVFFRDKGTDTAAGVAAAGVAAAAVAAAEAALTPRARARRALRGDTRGVAFEDVPLVRAYADAVAARVTRVRHEVPWVNAMSVEATADQVAALEALPFVARVDLVRGYRARREEDLFGRAEGRSDAPAEAPGDHCKRTCAVSPGTPSPPTTAPTLDYGPAAGQLNQIDVPAVHQMGLHGEGVIVAVFDAGFDTLSHEAFASMSIADRHDFVNGDDDVGNGSDKGEGSHGTETLSTLGGFSPGHLIGPAFNATFLLAKTEDTTSETPVEEDNWAAAAEWAEARGADVISSSLGYLTFDPGFKSYTFADMDGRTAISTRAADLAAARGVVVVNSAGNEGPNAQHNTLGAPADGRLVLAIGAVNAAGQRASFSSVGPTADGRTKPDVAAQGVSVVVAAPGSPRSYTTSSGTSFSCPLTAGVVALVLQARPSATVTQVEDAVRSTASQAARPDNLLGWGIVDAARAVQAIAR